MLSKPIVLSVDDEEGDAFLLAHKFTGKASPIDLQQVASGPKAIAYLEGTGEFAERRAHPFPDLLLLDIHMPVLDGFDVLRYVRGHSAFKYLPAIMLTSSNDPRDRQQATELGADGYLVKDAAFSQAVQAMQALARVWPNQPAAEILLQTEALPRPKPIKLPPEFRERVAQVEARLAASAKRIARARTLLDDRRELVARTLLSLQRSWKHLLL